MNAVSGAVTGDQQQQQDQSQQQQQQQDQQQQRPGWIDNLTDPTLKEGPAFERLSRYQSPDDVAKALIETQDFARGRIALPKEGDDASYQEFIAKVRPESADAYKFEIPEGDSGAVAEAFRPVAHQIGLTAQQAEAVSQFHNRIQSETLGKIAADSKVDLQAFELELGPEAYNTRLEAAGNMLARLPGFEGDKNAEKRTAAINALEQSQGARNAMQLLFTLAEATGELEKVDADAVTLRLGGMSPEQAQARIDEKMRDSEFMKLAADPTTKEAGQWKEWNRLAAGG